MRRCQNPGIKRIWETPDRVKQAYQEFEKGFVRKGQNEFIWGRRVLTRPEHGKLPTYLCEDAKGKAGNAAGGFFQQTRMNEPGMVVLWSVE